MPERSFLQIKINVAHADYWPVEAYCTHTKINNGYVTYFADKYVTTDMMRNTIETIPPMKLKISSASLGE